MSYRRVSAMRTTGSAFRAGGRHASFRRVSAMRATGSADDRTSVRVTAEPRLFD
jgi:hypothetical protein